MRNIKSLVEYLNSNPERVREYDAFKILDDNIKSLQDRIDNLEKKNMKYHVTCYKNDDQALPSGAVTTINFDITNYPQFGNMHDNIINPGSIYIRRSGVYTISASGYFSNGTLGTIRQLGILLTRNGAISYLVREYRGIYGGGVGLIMTCATSVYLYQNDVLSVTMYHNGGAGINCIGNPTDKGTQFSVTERMEDLSPSEYGLLDPNANMR